MMNKVNRYHSASYQQQKKIMMKRKNNLFDKMEHIPDDLQKN